jgi:putative acetyltransferase
MENVMIRPETIADVQRIRELNRIAFGSPGEAALVDALRAAEPSVISLVAEIESDVVGHILFSPVVVEGGEHVRAMALAPMAVAPDHQRRGIGTALIHTGLEACRRHGTEAVFVLGHHTYYPRFGFTRASSFSIRCEFDVPDEAFFAIELIPRVLSGVSGTVRYPNAFRTVSSA